MNVFSIRVIDNWNELPTNAIDAKSTDSFDEQLDLDKHWTNRKYEIPFKQHWTRYLNRLWPYYHIILLKIYLSRLILSYLTLSYFILSYSRCDHIHWILSSPRNLAEPEPKDTAKWPRALFYDTINRFPQQHLIVYSI